jgi:hypothetical protein
MKFKEEESRLMWEAFRSPQGKPQPSQDRDFFENDEDDFGMDDDLDINGFDDSDDFGLGDDSADFANDGLDTSVVMEFEPDAPVEPVMSNNNEVLVSELKKLSDYAKKLYDVKDQEFDDWMVSAITIASTYVSDVWHRLDAKQDLSGGMGMDQTNDFSEF